MAQPVLYNMLKEQESPTDLALLDNIFALTIF